MEYKGSPLHNYITLEELFTIHYFEYASNFYFPAERHDFWELICVDKGTVNITMDDHALTLHRGEIAFHKPGQMHEVRTDNDATPNLVVISFKCESPDMNFFADKVLHIDERERTLLANILQEARRVFATPLNDPYTTHMEKHTTALFGAEQLLRLYLEEFLICIRRRHTDMTARYDLPTTDENLNAFHRVSQYMQTHLSEKLTVSQICRDNMIGRTPLQKIIKQETGCGIMEFFSHLKIEEAKHLIRTGRLNFTQVSEQLGYNSIHYFSRQFKQITNMTPTEYAGSIKSISERTPS